LAERRRATLSTGSAATKSRIGKPAGSPRPRGRPSRDSSDDKSSRDRLLDAAIDLFARYGYDPVSTKSVAEASQLTQSMVHYHFGTKEQLWKGAIDRLMRKRGRAFPVARLEFRDVDPVTRLKILVRRLVEANAAEPNYVRILMHEAMAQTPRLEWLVDNYVAAGFDAFNQAVKLAIEDGSIRPLPVVDITGIITSATVLTFSIGAVINRIYGIEIGSERYVQSLSDSMIEILFQGLQLRHDGPSVPML
jgi:TetR/AcrR family transcriptional regulator